MAGVEFLDPGLAEVVDSGLTRVEELLHREVHSEYDFVTETTAGALPAIEWLNFDGGRIRAINLYYDRQPWQAVMAAIAERASGAPRASAVV